MPELPEVEVIRQRILPHVVGQTVVEVLVRNPDLRLPVSPEIAANLCGQTIHAVERRGKYLLFLCVRGSVILHLGMTGFLSAVDASRVPAKHDHLDMVLGNGWCLRFNDSRRFGLVLWTEEDPLRHPLLADLGPEPFDRSFGGAYLYRGSRSRGAPIKQFLLDQRVVAGIGNIYANEALFAARIHPARPATTIPLSRYALLAKTIRMVLRSAIQQGATILHSNEGSDYSRHFRLELKVYGRAGEPCPNCGLPIEQAKIAQRSGYFCRKCQR
jgi:formamidopyrimidine-DNA glycosylase